MIMGDNLFWELIFLTVIIHVIETLSYSVRLNSVKSGHFALSLSLFNLIVLVSRTANTLQGPLIGKLIDVSIENAYDPLPDIRKVVLAATVGTMIGILLIPTFLRIFGKATSRLETTGSVPGIVVQALSIANIGKIARSATRPKRSMIRNLRFRDIPKRLLLLNAIITGIYTIGVLSSFYSAYLVPSSRLAAASSSGIVNSLATILLTLFIDPKAAMITDEAFRGKRKYGDVKALVVMLIGTKLMGTLLGQLLLVPAAQIIELMNR